MLVGQCQNSCIDRNQLGNNHTHAQQFWYLWLCALHKYSKKSTIIQQINFRSESTKKRENRWCHWCRNSNSSSSILWCTCCTEQLLNQCIFFLLLLLSLVKCDFFPTITIAICSSAGERGKLGSKSISIQSEEREEG